MLKGRFKDKQGGLGKKKTTSKAVILSCQKRALYFITDESFCLLYERDKIEKQ